MVVLAFSERIDPALSTVEVVDGDGASVARTAPSFSGSDAVVELRAGIEGPVFVTWLVVGNDAHPVQGGYSFEVAAESLRPADTAAADFREGGVTEGALLGLSIRAGRFTQSLMLQVALGLTLFGFVVTPVLVGRGDTRLRLPIAAASRVNAYASRSSVALLVVAPVLFGLTAVRLRQVVPGTSFRDALGSSGGLRWIMFATLVVALVVAVVVRPKRPSPGWDVAQLGLLLSAVAVLGGLSHVTSYDPSWLGQVLFASHLIVTSLWAGGLLAVRLTAFGVDDDDLSWAVIDRFSRVMSVSLLLVVVTGLPMLVQLVAGWRGMWCSDFGVAAGYKVGLVGVAAGCGLVNRVLVRARHSLRKTQGGHLVRLRRLITAEAVVLLTVIGVSAVLAESTLPPAYTGRFLPGEIQEVVEPGTFASGCV